MPPISDNERLERLTRLQNAVVHASEPKHKEPATPAEALRANVGQIPTDNVSVSDSHRRAGVANLRLALVGQPIFKLRQLGG